MEKSYEELTFTDDFMFCKVLENNEDLCRDLLELLLGKRVRSITYPAKQKVIDITSDGKGIRLDAAVVKAKKHDEWRQEYMTLLMRDREKREEGRREGLAEGMVRAVDNVASELGISPEEACRIVGITMEQYDNSKK